MKVEDETAITEITIQPDGRIYVFGLSLEVAEVLSGLCPAGHAIERLVARLEKPPQVVAKLEKPQVMDR